MVNIDEKKIGKEKFNKEQRFKGVWVFFFLVGGANNRQKRCIYLQ